MQIFNISLEIKYISEDALLWFSENGSQTSTQKSTYTTDTMSIIYTIKDIPEGISQQPLN